jgi:imidazole glycerol-phosphate synthase subunit HisH
MITIVEYNAGNPTSVRRALAAVGVDSVVSGDSAEVRQAERIIFPGVGRASSTMDVLKARGLDVALREAFARGVPLLGICIGAQVSLSFSEEDDTPCLGLLNGRVRRFPRSVTQHDVAPLKVPHMGWNRISVRGTHPVLQGVPAVNEFYFVHSYYPDPEDASAVLAHSEHGVDFPCAFAHENLVATQFHPEKSGPLGLELLRRFAHWRP